MKVLVSDNYLQDIANAIRNRSGISDTFKPGEMAEGIANIPTPTTEDYMRISDLLEYPKTPDEEWYVESEVAKVEDLINHFESLDPGPEPGPEPEPLPEGYTELKCIIAHGTERINTCILPNDANYGFEAKFSIDSSSYTGDPSEGIWDWNIMNMGGISVDDNRFGFGGWLFEDPERRITGNYQPAGVMGGNTDTVNPGATPNQDYIVSLNYNHNLSCYINGSIISSNLVDNTYTYTHPWNVFTQTFDNNGEPQYDRFFYGKLYYLKIWLGTTLVRDYVPALDSNSIPCLYDRINGTANYNEGTGTLGYEEIENGE